RHETPCHGYATRPVRRRRKTRCLGISAVVRRNVWFSGRMRILRWTGAAVLIVLSALLIVASVAARVARSAGLNTDRYVDTVAPLASDPGPQAAITTRVTDAVIAKADLPARINNLAGTVNIPGAQAAAGLAGPALSNFLEGQVHKVVDGFVTSP